MKKNGIYGYRSHNFNIIPRELDSTGKKIETDTTPDSLKLHISPVGGSGRTLSCVSASLLGWWKQIDRMHFHALTSEVPRSLF
jgi:hypothetical protein